MSEETIDASDNSELEEFIKQKISAYIGVPLTPREFTQLEHNFDDNVLIVDKYPIHEILSLKINNQELTDNDYILDSNSSIIYFNKHYNGLLLLEYTVCLSDEDIEMYITPLVKDMVDYELDTGWTKNASSIHEGDVSISIDTSIGKGALIQKNLDTLKSMFNSYARMI